MTGEAKCGICGEPMPEGEQMFKFHGYSGPCRKPALEKTGYKYDVLIQGGMGPDVWDREIVVTEADIVDAARAAKARADEMGGHAVSVQQAC